MTPCRHPVLARLSAGYSEPKGRLPTCYSPVRHCTGGLATPFSFDLHVLGTPPAFALSQDQTLHSILKPLAGRRLWSGVVPCLLGLAENSDESDALFSFQRADFREGRILSKSIPPCQAP